jgi:hypothetical protein
MACIKPAKPASDVGPGMSPGYVAPSEASGNTGLPGAGPSEMSEETAVYEVGASETTSPPKRLHDVHELDS